MFLDALRFELGEPERRNRIFSILQCLWSTWNVYVNIHYAFPHAGCGKIQYSASHSFIFTHEHQWKCQIRTGGIWGDTVPFLQTTSLLSIPNRGSYANTKLNCTWCKNKERSERERDERSYHWIHLPTAEHVTQEQTHKVPSLSSVSKFIFVLKTIAQPKAHT